jgi:hypothetical protein
MTIYGQSDFKSIALSGVDHAHEKTKNETYIKITCAVCEPILIHMPGWAKDPRLVPLTYDEKLDAEAAEKEAQFYESQRIKEGAREARAAVQERTQGRPTRQGRGGANA